MNLDPLCKKMFLIVALWFLHCTSLASRLVDGTSETLVYRQFRHSFHGRNNISLVYASESIVSSASSFGHIFLVIHSNPNTPELNADVIQFFAKTPDSERGISYALKGLTGGFNARFERKVFFEKVLEYSAQQSRTLFIYNLKMDEEQKERFFRELFEIQDHQIKYFFISRNCASQIASLLGYVYHSQSEPSAVSLPSEVIVRFREKMGHAFVYKSLKQRWAEGWDLSKQRSQAKTDFANSTQPIQASDSESQDLFLEALKARARFLSGKEPSENYRSIQEQNRHPLLHRDYFEPMSVEKEPPILRFGASRISMALRSADPFNKADGFWIKFRPLFTDELDFQKGHDSYSALGLLNLEGTFDRQRQPFYRLTLLDLMQLPVSRWEWPTLSFKATLAVEGESFPRQGVFELLGGQTYALGGRFLLGGMMGPSFYGNLDSLLGWHSRVHFYWFLSNDWKLLASYSTLINHRTTYQRWDLQALVSQDQWQWGVGVQSDWQNEVRSSLLGSLRF